MTVKAPIVFMDTETTGLSLEDDIWEFAAVRREINGAERSFHMFIEHAEWKRRHLPESFREDLEKRYNPTLAWHPEDAAIMIREFFEGSVKPHVVGAVPNFDTERVGLLLERFNIRPNWHYHLIDVESLAIGYLAAQGHRVEPPWDSDAISAALGITPPTDARHTAMGDVYWTMENYDKVMGNYKG